MEVGTTQYVVARLEDRLMVVLNIFGAKAPFRAFARRHRSSHFTDVRRVERVPIGSINLSDIDGAAVFGYEPQD